MLPLFSLFMLFPCRLNAQVESDSYIRYMPKRSAKNTGGDVSVARAESSASCDYKAFGKLPVTLGVSAQYIGIDNTNPVKLPSRLTGASFDIETTFPFFDFKKTYLQLWLSPSFYSDSWDFPASAFRIPSAAYLAYLPDEKWTFLFGVAVFPGYRDEVFPVAGFIYRPNQRLSFNITPKRPNISYTLNKQLTLFLEGDANIDSEFEVDTAEAKNTVLRYGEARLGGGLKFSPNKNLEASFSAGGVFWRDFEYQEAAGKVDIQDGPYLEFRVRFSL